MKNALLFLLLLVSFQNFAQQDAIYSQYMFNQLVINPAYAGSRNTLSGVLLHRTRWTGVVKDAPTTSTFSAHSKIKKTNFAWGGNFVADRLGPHTNILVAATGAYHVKLEKGKLALGLRLGVFNSSLSAQALNFKDPSDVYNVGSKQTGMLPSVDFGLYYYTRKFYVGLSLNHLNNGRLNFDEIPNAAFYLKNYNTLGMGYAIEVNENLVLKPSFLLKHSIGSTSNLDINLSALLYSTFWVGVSVRNTSSINFLVEMNITDYMRIGYSYDAFFNGLSATSNGAHEFFIGFDFNTSKTKSVSTRYL